MKKFTSKIKVKNILKKKGIQLSISLQLIVGFIVPIVFLFIVGIVSYSRASTGMIHNYEKSTLNAIELAVESLDQGFKPIVSRTLALSQDRTVISYATGAYDSNTNERTKASDTIRENILVAQTADDFIHNIHIIPNDSNTVISTTTGSTSKINSFTSELKELYPDMYSDAGINWSGTHELIDSKLELNGEEYSLFCFSRLGNGAEAGLIVVDISANAMGELVGKLDLGIGSFVSFITEDNREWSLNGDLLISELDFYESKIKNQEELFSDYVDYNGESYYLIGSRSSVTGGIVTAMVPKKTITQEADGIKKVTLVMILLACIIAALLASVIITNISYNIKKSVKRLNDVAKGNLILKKEKKRNDEFGKVQTAITDTILNTRKLIDSVKEIIGSVSHSSEEVGNYAQMLNVMTDTISENVDGINFNISEEAKEIHSYRGQMEELSNTIKNVDKNTSEVVGSIQDTRKIIDDGIKAMDIMAEQSRSTYEVTGKVRENVNHLGEKLESIVKFVDDITGIASQTNLLSLNASIEAARAGESGRGFSVVAEEIRKLSEDSAKTAIDIRKVVDEVKDYTETTVMTVQKAEDIVDEQEKTVKHTEESFDKISDFMKRLLMNMEEVAAHMNSMNMERKAALSSIKNIQELSGKSVDSTEEVQGSIMNQLECTKNLHETSLELRVQMEELEKAIATFIFE